MRLTDGVVLLREPHEGDLDALHSESADPETQRWLNIAEDADQAAREYLDWAAAPDPHRLALTIADPVTDAYLGGIVAFLTPRTKIAELGYGVTAEARGRGVAVRAVKLICEQLFAAHGIRRIELRTHPENAASIRVAEKAGFTREGVERSSREIRGGRHDAVCFSLLPEDQRA